MLISIKPKYVKEIISGKKKYEYRKCIFRKNIDKVYMYSTSPEQRIIGYFEYKGYLEGTPSQVWEITKEFSGIDDKSYYEYFDKSSCAYAIKIERIYLFPTPIDPKTKFKKFIPPQSYKYLKGDID